MSQNTYSPIQNKICLESKWCSHRLFRLTAAAAAASSSSFAAAAAADDDDDDDDEPFPFWDKTVVCVIVG
jgi:hypothetical protein